MTDAPNPSRSSFEVEADATARYWHKSKHDTLPPPDMMGAYMHIGRCRRNKEGRDR